MQLIHGDALQALREMPDASADAVITDPPYGLRLMGKDWDDSTPDESYWREVMRAMKPASYLLAMGGSRTYHRLACAIEDAGFEIRDCLMWLYGTGFPKGKGTLKPGYEPILMARRPGPKVLPLGIDECRVSTNGEVIEQAAGKASLCGTSEGWNRPWKSNPEALARRQQRANEAIEKANKLGRYPANVAHDGSEEVLEAFGGKDPSPSRFFYCAKPSIKERGEGNNHPTVKPLALMRWLVRLVCPPGGIVLDPFMGSGTTGVACVLEGRDFIGVERVAEYHAIAARRINETQAKRSGEAGDLFASLEPPAEAG